MGWSSLPTFTPGTNAKAEDIQTVANDVGLLYGGTDVLRVALSTNYSANTAGFAVVTFDTVQEDSANGWDSGSHQYTVQTPGIYQMSLTISWGANGSSSAIGTQLAYQTQSGNPTVTKTNWQTVNIDLGTQDYEVVWEDRFLAGGTVQALADAPSASPIPNIQGLGGTAMVIRWVRN